MAVLRGFSVGLLLGIWFSHGLHGGVVRLLHGEIDTCRGSSVRALAAHPAAAETQTYIVQFDHELDGRTRAALTAAGAEVCGYVPDRALLVRGDSKALGTVAELPGVVWMGEYVAAYKLSPALQPQKGLMSTPAVPLTNVQEYLVSVWDTAAMGSVHTAVRALGGSVGQEIQRGGRAAVRIRLPAGMLPNVAQLAAVEWIEPWVPPHFCMNIATSARGINVSNVWYTHGLTGAGQLVGHADSGIDTGNEATVHPDLRGRIARAHALVREGDWSDALGHGTHTAGLIAGTGAASHGGQFRGVAPGAQLVHQTITDTHGIIGDVVFDLYGVLAQAYEDGARIHSDSWGTDAYGHYTWLSRMVDQFVWDEPEMLVVCAAGNNGWDANRDGVVDRMGVIAPATAKNVLSVGGAETWRAPGSGGLSAYTWYEYWPLGFPLEPLASDHISYSADGVRRGMAGFSSRGPTADNRIKPDIVAPATDIVSCRSRMRGVRYGWGVYDDNYIFAGGTSVATPLVAGAAALAREFLVTRTIHTNPSAALVKALLLGGAQSLAPGQFGYGTTREIPAGVPNVVEGWGFLNVEHALVPADETLALLADGARLDTAQTNAYTLVVTNAAVLRAWLVYNDYPASLAAALQLVNDLDLIVRTPAGTLYYDRRAARPNRFDNVESVQCTVPAGTSTIWVTGHQVPYGPQRYALLVRTGPLPVPVVRVEDVQHMPVVLQPGVPMTVSAHVAHSMAGTLIVRLHLSTNRTAWYSVVMPQTVVTEHGSVHSVTIPGWNEGAHGAYVVEARVGDIRVASATNEVRVSRGEVWVAREGAEQPPYDSAATGFRTITAAARYARAGSAIMVAPGTYRERRIRVKPSVRLQSVAGAEQTIIDAGGREGPCVILAGAGAVLDGFTVQGAQTIGDGGGVRMYAGAAVINCMVRDNRAARYGGGVYLEHGGSVSNCVITRNIGAYGGGGVLCNGGGLITDSVISGNGTHRAYGEGGGVALVGAARLLRARVERNRAMVSGGGVWCSDGAEVADTYVARNRTRIAAGGINAPRGALVRATTIAANSTRGQGGGLSAGSGSRIMDCVVAANRAKAGGGLRVFDATVVACTLVSNRARNGGGVFSNSGIISNSLVVANQAREGGGVWCEYLAEPRLLVVKKNRAQTGGGMFVTRKGVVKDCQIVGNAAREGGGIAYQNGALVETCVISSNVAFAGGGLWGSGGAKDNAAPRVAKSLVHHNLARRGGGAWLQGAAIVRSALVAENYSAGDAGGVYVADQARIENCLLTCNTARRMAGGVAGDGGSVINSIVYGNSAPVAPEYNPRSHTITFAHSCVAPLPPGPGNIARDPRLAAKTGAYRPAVDSPCIDAGVTAAWMFTETDYNGQARVLGVSVDMGCYEFARYPDDQPPLLSITGPFPGQIFAYAQSNQTVRGTVTDDYGTFPVMHNAKPVRTFTPPRWSDRVSLAVGTNVLQYTVMDAAGQAATATVACVLLPRYSGPVVVNTTVYVAHAGAHVAPFLSWPAAATNLTDALLAAGSGCTILISNGQYRLAETAELHRPVTVRGVGNVVLDGQGARRCLTLFVTGVVLDNLVISNGSAAFGAGMYARYDALLNRCVITDNRATVHGGGIFCERALTLRDTHITANYAGQRGGGIFAGNDLVMTGCVLEHNYAATDAGGLWCAYAGRVYASVFRANSASNDGGGLVCASLGDVRACLFEHNVAGRGGGARVMDESRIISSIFRRNSAVDGGGLAAENSRIRNVLCHDNLAVNAGGGVFSGPGGVLENCTLVFNTARRGGGAWCTRGTQVRNAIIYFNTQGNVARRGADVLISFSCTTPHTPGASVITAPPQFADAAAGDFRLAPGSPCIDAATRLPWMARSTDLYGAPRVLGRAPDMGACEFGAVSGLSNLYAHLASDVPEPRTSVSLFVLGAVLRRMLSRRGRGEGWSNGRMSWDIRSSSTRPAWQA